MNNFNRQFKRRFILQLSSDSSFYSSLHQYAHRKVGLNSCVHNTQGRWPLQALSSRLHRIAPADNQ